MIQSIHFEGLFGRFDYDVVFDKEGLTILTGPNGYGKSTILKSIEALATGIGGIVFFSSLDFRKMTACFEYGKQIVIEKKQNELFINNISIQSEVLRKSFEHHLNRIQYVSRIDEETWYDRRRGARITLSDYINNFIDNDNFNSDDGFERIFSEEIVKTLKDLKNAVGKIYFIKEQRLIKEQKKRFDEQEVVNVIQELPDKFRKSYANAQQAYSSIANKLDSTYPNRLFTNEEGLTEAEYQEKMKEMASKFEKLSKYGLSVLQNSDGLVFKEEHAKALKIYFDDFEKKYNVYKDFITKLDLYTDIVNNRLSFKHLEISKRYGVRVIDDSEKVLKLEQLSSGEKQEIVLFYDLIFGTQDNVLLLIDEPEISLHIVWQKKFMDDLLRIISYKKISAIVATHSPQIINNHWERQIDLGALYAEQLNKR